MLRWFLVLTLVAPLLAGCLPGENRLDDEKDPHFQQGRLLVNSQDLKGATDEFEKALLANPHSAAAHFELGWLYEKSGDYAAAVYHYQRHLQLRPDSPRAAAVRERIRGCKQELANSEFPLPNNQNLQHEVDRLRDENALLHQQLDATRAQLATRPPAPVFTPNPNPNPPPSPAPSYPRPTPLTVAPSPAPSAKSYTVKSGDSLASIARARGITSTALQNANPGVNPRKLRVGQTLNLP